ncbi:MAG: prephenate dehydrogenase [Gammaproteobacteria bacterium]
MIIENQTGNIKLKHLTIIGVGLIGGSLAAAVKKANPAVKIVGCGRNEANLQKAVDLGVIDHYETDIQTAVSWAEIVVVAVPLGAMRNVFTSMLAGLPDNAVVTDVGSAKGSVVNEVRETMGDLFSRFVPAHPIAGSEKSSVLHARSDLYHDRYVILTPMDSTSDSAVEQVKSMWALTGARISIMDVVKHDEVLAATSHLPHVLAYALVDTLANMDESEEIFQYAAGGFKDFTRIAASDPEMWRDICVSNSNAIIDVLDRFNQEIDQVRSEIASGNGELLMELFTRVKAIREKL